MTRWETAVDTMPVIVTADRFVAHENEHEVLAHNNVHIAQGPNKWAASDEARFDQTASTLFLWGTRPVFVHWADLKGISDFHGDKGTVTLKPKQARLMNHVQGHIIPL
jgi:lipopolysaccharide assembly outer membrane protein LptD (OstA)